MRIIINWLKDLRIFIILLFIILLYSNASAQISSLACTAPVEISAGALGKSFMPKITADAAGGLHVFWNSSDATGDTSTQWVSYSTWNGKDWSVPLDVFYSGEGSYAFDGQAVADKEGYLHTLWLDSEGLQYARRYVNDPISARSWVNQTTVVSSPFRSIGPFDVALDDQEILHVVYWHAGADIPGVYYTRSSDGVHWDFPLMISNGNWPDVQFSRQEYQVSVLPVGDVVYAAWSEPDFKIFQANGFQGGESWSYPHQFQSTGQWVSQSYLPNDGLGLFSIGTPPGNLGICFKMQATSPDKGNTWGEGKIILEPYIKGCLGKMTVLADNQRNTHLVTSAYLFDAPANNEKIWYSSWELGGWQVPQLVSWPGFDYTQLGDQPDFPTAAISLGNQLNIVFHVTEGRIWYTQCKLPADAVQPVSFPTLETKVEAVEPTQSSQILTLSDTATPPLKVSSELKPIRTFDPSIIGMFMSFLVIAAFIAFRFLRKDHGSHD
jgi:hypothetical protein